ncbi:MAG TPA: hypothetical protein VM715_04700 [Candidatus Acidoferrum sp.]|nr:hypothetical protein [Candidatus Acidoferrum sp.]
MPRATSNKRDETLWERKELKTCEGGFVLLRKLDYGEMQARRAFTSKMSVKSGRKKSNFEGEMALMDRCVQAFEFAHTIMDHNLEDEGGRKLDFQNQADVESLDGAIGEEIARLIDDMNQPPEDDEEEEGNS